MTDPGWAIGTVFLLGADDEVTYNWFHYGRGTESTTDANAEGWRQVRDAYDEVLFLVRRGLAESNASWTGMAADGALALGGHRTCLQECDATDDRTQNCTHHSPPPRSAQR